MSATRPKSRESWITVVAALALAACAGLALGQTNPVDLQAPAAPVPVGPPPIESPQEGGEEPAAPTPPPVLDPTASEPTTNHEIIPSPPPKPVVRRRKPVDPLAQLAKDAAPVEIEAALSQSPDLYVLVDPAEGIVEVRSRGISLDTMKITRSEVLFQSGVFATGEPPHFPAPSLWKVQKTPDDAIRELVAPAELKRYVPEDEREDTPTGTPTAKPRQETQPPTSYRIPLNDGWDLAILGELPERGFFVRLTEAARNGWLRLVGRPTAHPPTLALVLEADDSRRLHHVFREGLPILLSPRHSD
jgi:hypothetical protein